MNKKFVCMILDEMAHTNNVWALKNRIHYEWDKMTYCYQCDEALKEMKNRIEKYEHINNELLMTEAIDCSIKVQMGQQNSRMFTNYIQECIDDGTFDHMNWFEED